MLSAIYETKAVVMTDYQPLTRNNHGVICSQSLYSHVLRAVPQCLELLRAHYSRSEVIPEHPTSNTLSGVHNNSGNMVGAIGLLTLGFSKNSLQIQGPRCYKEQVANQIESGETNCIFVILDPDLSAVA